MKQLILLRHAKSSWTDPALSDFDRPLNRRGLKDAPRTGARIAEQIGRPARLITSPAVRALTTAHLIAGPMLYPEDGIDLRQQLYDASAAALIAEIQLLDDNWGVVLLIGHNPGITDAAALLSGSNIERIPTCGTVAMTFAVDSWAGVCPGEGAVDWLDSPKRPGSL